MDLKLTVLCAERRNRDGRLFGAEFGSVADNLRKYLRDISRVALEPKTLWQRGYVKPINDIG